MCAAKHWCKRNMHVCVLYKGDQFCTLISASYVFLYSLQMGKFCVWPFATSNSHAFSHSQENLCKHHFYTPGSTNKIHVKFSMLYYQLINWSLPYCSFANTGLRGSYLQSSCHRKLLPNSILGQGRRLNGLNGKIQKALQLNPKCHRYLHHELAVVLCHYVLMAIINSP